VTTRRRVLRPVIVISACTLLSACNRESTATPTPTAKPTGSGQGFAPTPQLSSPSASLPEIRTSTSTPTPTSNVAHAPLSCGIAGSAAVQVVKNVTDVNDLAVAATNDSALVTFDVEGDHGCPYDGCYVYGEAYQVAFDASSTPSKIAAPPAAMVGVSPGSDAVPFVMGGALHLFTQGHGGAAPTTMPGQDAPDTIYVVRDGKILTRSSKWFSGSFAAAPTSDGAIVLGTGVEWQWYRTGNDDSPRSARVFKVASDASVTGELVEKTGPPVVASKPGARPDGMTAPAISAAGDRAAYAYHRTKKDGAQKDLVVGLVDTKSGKPIGAPVLVASGDLGRPAVLLDGDTLHVVWAARDRASDPYTLRRATLRFAATATLDAGPSELSAPSAISTPTSTALSPSIAKVGGSVALAWMDAADTKHGAIWAGAGATLDDAARAAEQRSAADVKNARDPRWGATGDRAALAWTEHDGPRRVRLSWCTVRKL
jgi:hypothetical protein